MAQVTPRESVDRRRRGGAIHELPKLANVQPLVKERLFGVRNLPGTCEVFRRYDVEQLANLRARPALLADGDPAG